MKFGPVPSKTYDLLRDDPEELAIEVGDRRSNARIFSQLRVHDELELSESDEIKFKLALKAVEPKSFFDLKKFTHDHVAWKAACEGRNNNAPPMEYAKLFQKRDQDRGDYIARFSKQVGCAT